MASTDPTSSPSPTTDDITAASDAKAAPTSPWRCFGGVAIAAPMAYALYQMTLSIAQTLADNPIKSNGAVANNIAVLVRTLVIGMVALAAGIFALVALGLLALGIQLLVKSAFSSSASQDA
ncbi:MAG: DUF3082 domain-containing protein [Elainellaceae cyanobacterium]